MRRVPTVLAALAVCCALLQPATTRAAVGPLLQVSESTLASSLKCPATFSGKHNPVLFVHGTTLTADSNWSWNYGKVLPTMGYDVCAVNLPDRARADIQISAEYVVYAIRSMAERSNRKVDVVGFSQGPLEPRWAIKYWPDIPQLVDNLVAMAGVGHGFTETQGICASECIAPFWQMKPDSKFLAALNSGSETPAPVTYTSVYSRTDQFVWYAGSGYGDPWDQSAQLKGAKNIAVQDICPGRYVEHIQAVYDAVYFAVVMDALTHPGGADASRIDKSVCTQGMMAGVDPGQALSETVEIDRDLMVLTGEHHVDTEPRTATYAGG